MGAASPRPPPDTHLAPACRSSLLKAATGSPAGLVLTTYEHLRLHRSLLLPVRWGLAVLDEGHKIRNPDSEVTLVAKQVSDNRCT